MNKIKIIGVIALMVIGFVTLSMVVGGFCGLLILGGLTSMTIYGSFIYLIPVIIGALLVFAAPPLGYYFGKHVIKEVVEVFEKD